MKTQSHTSERVPEVFYKVVHIMRQANYGSSEKREQLQEIQLQPAVERSQFSVLSRSTTVGTVLCRDAASQSKCCGKPGIARRPSSVLLVSMPYPSHHFTACRYNYTKSGSILHIGKKLEKYLCVCFKQKLFPLGLDNIESQRNPL